MSTKQIITKSPLTSLLREIDSICIFCAEAPDTQHLLDKSLQKALSLIKAQRGSIFILDKQTKELVLKASVGMKLDDKRHLIKNLGQGIIGQVVELKEPLLVENISKEERFRNYKSRGSYQTESFICSPLILKEQVIGVINISDKISKKPFTQREFQILNFLCNQIALNYHRLLMTRELESQERLVTLGKLAGGIAHEFNNPLDGVMRYNNLCMSHAQNNEVLREYLTEVQMGLKRMANIVKNLLACARQTPVTGNLMQVDFNKTIEQSLKEIYPYLTSKNIRLIRNFSDNLPPITDWGIERVASNLIKNAVDAIDKDGVIEITTLLKDGFIKLKVADNGRGIANEDLEKIFEPFFTTKDIDKGCGLGLTVVNEIVNYYNGKIKVKSKIINGLHKRAAAGHAAK